VTQILNLPTLTFPMTIANNEDWTDAWAYLDVYGNPISLAGLILTMMLRAHATDEEVQIIASSISGPVNGLPQNGSLASGGDGLNVIALAIPRATVGTLAPGGYVFEVQATGDGLTRTIADGPVTVNAGVVR
jgi:hypothetical protein